MAGVRRAGDAAVAAGRRHVSAADKVAGIGLMVAAVFLFTCMDTIGKTLMASYPVQQVVWARYAFQFVLISLPIPLLGLQLVRTRHPFIQTLRGLLLAFGTLCMFAAISVIPLANAYTVNFVAPLLITVLSIPMLKERVGWRRWSAVVVGFLGVLIVLRPGLGVMHPAAFLPLITATCFALYQIITRIMGAGTAESPLTMLFHLALVGTLVLSLVVPFYWQPVAPGDWPWLAAMGVLGGAGHLLLIRGLTLAPASLLAPFMYTQLLWGLGLGYWVFGDLPDVWTLVGCTVIVASGLYIFYREGVLGRA